MTRRRVTVAAVVVALTALAACGGGGGGHAQPHVNAPTTTAPRERNPAYARPGPYPVGFTTLQTRTRAVDVFYPGKAGSQKGQDHATYDIRAAERSPDAKPLKSDPSQLVDLSAYADLPTAPGPFPVVLFSHDYGSFPLQTSSLESDLAAWGFVVIAPDHIERDTFALSVGTATVDDARDASVLRQALNAVAADPTLGAILDSAHVAAVGDAQGGATALTALSLPQVGAAVAWASVPPPRAVAAKPVLLVGASRDHVDGKTEQQAIYDNLEGPRSLVLLGGGAGHATFLDNCEIMRIGGDLVAGGDVTDPNDPGGIVELSRNGCYPDEVDPMLAWSVIAHFTVAFLRSTFLIDPQPVGLGDAMVHAFPKVPLTYQHSP